MENSKSNSKTKAKTKASGSTKKTVTASKASKTKKSTAGRSLPDENEIRRKAQEIYNERTHRGEHGTAEDDWVKAERLLKGLK
jgi:hypothetical protein